MSDAAKPDEGTAQDPSDTVLEEPSTEKEPGEEPRAPEPQQDEPNHHAVGIGVIDGDVADVEEADRGVD